MTDSDLATTSKLADPREWEAFFEQRVKRNRRLTDGYVKFVADMAGKGLPPIFEGRHLATLLGVTPSELSKLTSSQKYFYRQFSIPKRSGGERTISAPMPLMAHCQRWIDQHILRSVNIHDAAHGYVDQRSNVSNALMHLQNRALLKADIVDFFASISEARIVDMFYKLGYPPNVAYLLARLCTLEGSAPQGSAASPRISNIILKDFDDKVSEYAQLRGLKYTRYADDIALSGDETRRDDMTFIDIALRQSGFLINSTKSRFQLLGKKIVTGISIGSGRPKLPRELRRRFKNEAFLALKAAKSPSDDAEALRDPISIDRHLGRIAYWRNIEPDNDAVEELFQSLLLASKSPR